MNLLDTPTPGQRNPDGMPPEWSDRPAAIAALVIALALLFALFAPPALGQIGSDQLKLKTNGGLGGDSSRSLGIEVYRGTSGPASPETGAFWCDTNSTPCALKMYDGDSWEVVSPAANITTQDDASSLPGTPSDGQLVFMRSCKCLWIYSSTGSTWYRLDTHTTTAGPDLVETWGGTVITTPASAPTVTAASGGSATAGTHVCAVTFVNSTGGETDGGPSSSSVTIGSPNFTYSFSSIPTGGSGTTARRLYCSKANSTTPLYWVGTVADNSTTTATSTLADASFGYRMPSTNFSAALPSGWDVDNWDTGYTDRGGCGSTGSSVWCQTPRPTSYAQTGTSDTCVRLHYEITTYQDVAFDVRWSILQAADYVGGANVAIQNGYGVGGFRNGDAASAIRHTAVAGPTAPLGGANLSILGNGYRSTAGGSGSAASVNTPIGGPGKAFPVYYHGQSTGATYYRSIFFGSGYEDGPFHSPTGIGGTTEATYAFGYFSSGSPPSRWEVCLFAGSGGAAIEIGPWSLTQE